MASVVGPPTVLVWRRRYLPRCARVVCRLGGNPSTTAPQLPRTVATTRPIVGVHRRFPLGQGHLSLRQPKRPPLTPLGWLHANAITRASHVAGLLRLHRRNDPLRGV